MSRERSKVTILVLLCCLLFTTTATATTYTTLALPSLDTDITTWTDGDTYNSVIPGSNTWNGVPFQLQTNNEGNNAFTGLNSTTKSISIPVNIYGVTKAYTIINSAYGSEASVVGKIQFIGSSHDSTTYLIEGVNIRDHYNDGYVNIIDGFNTVPAYDPHGGARLDMQTYDLSASANDTLLEIRFTSYALGDPYGNPFIAAATVASGSAPVPEPCTMLLLGSGLTGVAAFRRKFRAP